MEAARERAKTVATEYEAKIKEEKPTRYEIAQRVYAQVGRSDLNLVYDVTVELLHKNRMCTGMFVVRDIIGTVLSLGDNREYRQRVLKIFSD